MLTLTTLEFAAIRKQLGIGSRRMGRYMGVDERTIRAWETERGPRGPAAMLAILLASRPTLREEIARDVYGEYLDRHYLGVDSSCDHDWREITSRKAKCRKCGGRRWIFQRAKGHSLPHTLVWRSDGPGRILAEDGNKLVGTIELVDDEWIWDCHEGTGMEATRSAAQLALESAYVPTHRPPPPKVGSLRPRRRTKR